jgi:hypothetical protein
MRGRLPVKTFFKGAENQVFTYDESGKWCH